MQKVRKKSAMFTNYAANRGIEMCTSKLTFVQSYIASWLF